MTGTKDNNMIFGLRPIIEAIEAGKQIDKVFIQKGLKGDIYSELIELSKTHKLAIKYVPVEKLNRFTRKNHQGVVAFIAPVSFHSIEDVLPMIYEKGETPLLLILDEVTDVRNFGAIVRTAECAGVHAVVIPQNGSAAIGPDAVKTSTGAIFKIPICKESSLKKTLEYLQLSGVKLVACTEKAQDDIYVPDYTGPAAIIMGNEERGINNNHLRIADHLAKIPMSGEIASLNVSVACGIILYEAVRQRL